MIRFINGGSSLIKRCSGVIVKDIGDNKYVALTSRLNLLLKVDDDVLEA
jgi:V8-like Glu-specific endopeptidase